jgi:uncharacterized membrane-anchored protein YjiN (DUF445 family)
METNYCWTVTEDNEIEFTKDTEIINENHDRLALTLSEFIQTEDADYYASYLVKTGVKLYNQAFKEDVKRKKSLRYQIIKMFKQLLRDVRK